jgi:hypothetical protein
MSYKEYTPISKKGDQSTFIPEELLKSQEEGIEKIPKNIKNDWDHWVASKIDITKEKLFEIFSAEQIDSIGLAILNFENGNGMIISDETGIGKGRILSGICKWAFLNNKKVLFFTEREHLFTDFWRDLKDTETIKSIINPILFHSNSKIYDQEGKPILKSNPSTVKEIQKNGFPLDTNLVLTNYSQISFKDHIASKKDLLIEYSKDNVIILDESHNAAGDSNVNNFLLKLLDITPNFIFSSATFIKDETHIKLYEKILGFDKDTTSLLKRLLNNSNEQILRKIITYELTKKLKFWRREHEPIEVNWNNIICEQTEKEKKYLDKYAEIINDLFTLSKMISADQKTDLILSNWATSGATINRLSRSLILMFKINKTVESVKKTITDNEKAVIVMNSTFSSIIKKIIDHTENKKTIEKEDNIEYQDEIEPEIELKTKFILNFKKALDYIIDDTVGDYINEQKDKINNKEIFNFLDFIKAKTELFSDLSISPIDEIINKLKNDGIECSEISGRTFKVNENNEIEKINKESRQSIIKKFNDGQTNVVILTRAGSAGISLHSSKEFKDTRKRQLYELEITDRPTYRLQFIGRVNRKNQLNKPGFNTITTNHPFEQRILNLEQIKLQKLQSHISGDEMKHFKENIFNLYTDKVNENIFLFLKNNQELAFKMGINIKKSPNEDYYFLNSILKRCIILNSEQQNFIYDFLIYCQLCEEKVKLNNYFPKSIQVDKVKTFWQQMTEQQKNDFTQSYKNFPLLTLNQLKFPWVGTAEVISTYETKLNFNHKYKEELEINKNKNNDIKLFIEKYIQNISLTKEYIDKFLNQQIIPLISKIEIGKIINIETNENKIFGYIHDITIPKIKENFKYAQLFLIHIKTINPHINPQITYPNDDFYITLDDFIMANSIKFYNQEINWQQYERPQKELQRKDLCWIGHPIYVEFIKQAYSSGKTKFFNVAGVNQVFTIIPNHIKKVIDTIKKPYYGANHIMENFITKKITKLSTVWEDPRLIKPTLKLEATKTGYTIHVAKEIIYNKNIIDYKLKQSLKDYKGTIDSFDTFFIQFKEMRKILFMLEQRGVIWFNL